MTDAPRAARGVWRRVADAWYRVLCVLMVTALVVLLVPVSLQILSRHTGLIPGYIWTEELARLMFIWIVMIGAMVGLRERTHFVVDLWPTLSARANARVELMSGVGILVFAGVFVYGGWEFTEFAIYRISELAELPLWTIHMAWPLLGLTWLLFQGEHMIDMLRVLRSADTARN
ncbi:MAG: TRAP transporter small permease [Burkholderiaceae bacterium]|jgi:TRAP-type C4-dicarboxylate transport system permease small subunit